MNCTVFSLFGKNNVHHEMISAHESCYMYFITEVRPTQS